MQSACRKTTERSGTPSARTSPDQMVARYPQHRPLPGDTIVLDLEAGFLRPDAALVAAAAEAERQGAVVERYARVEALEPDADGVTVRAGSVSHRFRAAVVAPGPWTAALLPQLGPVLEVKRPLQGWFAARHPERFAPHASPVYMRVTNGAGCYVLPSVDGVAVKLGLSEQSHRIVGDPDRLDRTVSTDEMRRLREVAELVLPDVYPDPIRLGAYMEAYTPDRHALVGRMPGAPSMVALCGFSGHGFKLAPLFGDIAAELVLEGRTSRSIGHLAPERFKDVWR